jgi:uncharacterized SAM-binding protein YcdF (DUF218 family)
MSYCDEDLGTLNQPAQPMPHLRRWLARADTPRNADLIFILAGRVSRKEYALELFRKGLAPRILFSVGRFEIRRFSKMALPVPLDLLKLAQELPPLQRHYFVFFYGQLVQVEHVPPRRFGTLTEIETLAGWLSKNPDIRSVLVVSSDTHLRRIRMCCHALLDPKVELAFLDSPSSQAEQSDAASSDPEPGQVQPAKRVRLGAARDELLELFKIAVYWLLLKMR